MLGILSCQKDIKPATPPNHCAFCHVGNGKNDGTRIVIQDVVTKYCGGNYDEVLKLEGTNTGLAAGAVWKVQCPEAKPE